MTTEPAPISNGVPEKCAQVGFRIEQPVTDYPDNQQPDRDETQGVAVKEALFTAGRHESLAHCSG